MKKPQRHHFNDEYPHRIFLVVGCFKPEVFAVLFCCFLPNRPRALRPVSALAVCGSVPMMASVLHEIAYSRSLISFLLNE